MNVATQAVVPAAAALMLLALGMTLDSAHLGRLVERPRALALGLLVRWFVGPAIALGLCALARPPEPVALGLLLVACCPLGTPVPAMVRACRGDVPLALLLTALTNLASPVVLPGLLSVGSILLGLEGTVRPGALGSTALRIGTVVLVPTALGMAIRRRRPALARRIEPKVTPFAVVMIALIVAMLLVTSREHVVTSLVRSGALALGMNLLAIGLAALLGLGARLEREERVSLLLGAGLFNFGLHAFVSLTLLKDERVLMPAIAYGILMWASATGVAAWARRSSPGQRGAVVARSG